LRSECAKKKSALVCLSRGEQVDANVAKGGNEAPMDAEAWFPQKLTFQYPKKRLKFIKNEEGNRDAKGGMKGAQSPRTLIASMAYSTWNNLPSGEKVFTPLSYSLLQENAKLERETCVSGPVCQLTQKRVSPALATYRVKYILKVQVQGQK
jgi:hypothetical protein